MKKTTVGIALAAGAATLTVGIVAINDTKTVTGNVSPIPTLPVTTTPPPTLPTPLKPAHTPKAKPPTTPPLPPTAKPSLAPAPKPTAPALAGLVEKLRAADEGGPDYDREEFGSRAPTAATRDRLLTGERRADGSWYSKWDGKSWRDPSRLDADHTVALAEAWSSGAHAWSKSKRIRFANDLTSPFTLNLITDTLNQQVKSDKDPFDWMPDINRCRYVMEWTQVKLAWNLTADGEEKMALHNAAVECDRA